MAGGYIGKLLWVDLSGGHIREESVDEQIARDFIGGYGLGVRMIYGRQRAGVNSLGPDNILGVLTGPCSGTGALVGSRFMVVGKSPLTGGWGDSDCGGYFGPQLKFAGFDGVFFTGISERPVYLYVQHGKAELRDARHLWGKDTTETDEMLKAELGKKVEIACIGPAGEKLSLIACVIHDKGRAAGRSGLGALMGSKGLKAIVAQGDMSVPVASEARLRELRKKYLAQLKESDLFRRLNEYGTCSSLAPLVYINLTPIKNWSGIGPVDFPTAERISGSNVTNFEVKKYACYRCPMACGGHTKVATGPYTVEGHKPEYETLASFGAMTLTDNVESMIKLNDLCNRAGIDTISAGTTVAFAMECYENGLITSSDTGGIELQWGNAEAVVAMVQKMAKREGFGDILADGVKAAADRIGKGAEEYAVHCGGQEPGMHDSRHRPGLAISYQLDATPGRHGQGGHWMEGFPDWWKRSLGVAEIPSGPDKYDYAGKGEVFKRAACMLHFIHASGLCRFPWYCIDPACMWEFVSAVTGWDIDGEEAYRIGERIADTRQAFNVREGLNALKHPLHPRMVGLPPLEEGATKGITLDMDTLLGDFLKAMEWDPVTARPSAKRLNELGLKDVAEDLWQEGESSSLR
jgi:aldehyde:ferredoxin oxidoreductase